MLSPVRCIFFLLAFHPCASMAMDGGLVGDLVTTDLSEFANLLEGEPIEPCDDNPQRSDDELIDDCVKFYDQFLQSGEITEAQIQQHARLFVSLRARHLSLPGLVVMLNYRFRLCYPRQPLPGLNAMRSCLNKYDLGALKNVAQTDVVPGIEFQEHQNCVVDDTLHANAAGDFRHLSTASLFHWTVRVLAGDARLVIGDRAVFRSSDRLLEELRSRATGHSIGPSAIGGDQDLDDDLSADCCCCCVM